ncbi:adenosylcobinamide-GDP ribazoletransferase [Shewanella sp. 202IG2-18]|uniref:adenosylcobinamide-GDP ribazoletransferase n=1 Tax=Parashewanella hymeniacidonis TaxID=2807618 RepID=UPI0019602B0B|nr:adenosylcobinamide-GDP ribazoletransferase [Parashewanella hymeniacidonis]MBM7071791.1 adenosylcobinamide-GDP ribazoletransferase [Parashewanella hymeniacidonis]
MSLNKAQHKKNWHLQLDLFFIALGFFSRIPMPAWVDVDATKLNQASRYFGVVGLVIGTLSSCVFWCAQLYLPPSIAVILSIIASVLITGAFHEDGLADTADGFGGGWKSDDKLKIMKDSRLGSYGTLALILAIGMKWQLLVELALYDPNYAVIAIIASHGLSRVFAASIIFTEEYVRESDDSKSKPLANEQSWNELLILMTTGLVILFTLDGSTAICLLVLLSITRFLTVLWFRKQIGGYTGDTLGAAQQISEVVIYTALLLLGAHG